MPLLGFKKRFAPLVLSGKKRTTIRKKRKDGKDPKRGDYLYLYTGLRTKKCEHLRNVKCKDVREIFIRSNELMNIGGFEINIFQRNKIARWDGFKNFAEMLEWFHNEHGLPFEGLWIRW